MKFERSELGALFSKLRTAVRRFGRWAPMMQESC